MDNTDLLTTLKRAKELGYEFGHDGTRYVRNGHTEDGVDDTYFWLKGGTLYFFFPHITILENQIVKMLSKGSRFEICYDGNWVYTIKNISKCEEDRFFACLRMWNEVKKEDS